MHALNRRLSARESRGFAMSSPLALLSAAAVLLAGAAFVATNGQHAEPEQARPAAATASPSASATTEQTAKEPVFKKKKKKAKPVVRRGETFVTVFNNSGISGLAGSTASRAQGAGWQVVGSDNWYGTIDASTVYYPPKLKAAAALLGKDLGIARLKPSIAPMQSDRLTVILTRDYA